MSLLTGSELLIEQAQTLVLSLNDRSVKVATAESCTGGLLSALITEIPGSSEVFERGFVTYSNEAKADMLGVPMELIENHGAVSAEVARAMALGALENSDAQITLSITGIAGPGGGTDIKPVGLVHFAACGINRSDPNPLCVAVEKHFGDIGRAQVRWQAVATAITLLEELVKKLDPI